jgi:hypothetical protein
MMRYGQLMALFLCLVMLPPDRAAAQPPNAAPDLGANAALKYWQAFAVLPAMDKDQERLLQGWNKVPLDGTALALVERSRNSRLYLHRGAKLSRCDWSLDVEDGVGLLLSHCPRSLTLARLAALHARHAFERGDPKAGWEDVIDLLKLGRHVGMSPPFVVRWVDYKIETMAIEAAAPYLPELKPILPEAAPAVLDGLPAAPTLAQMVLSEKQIGLRWLIENMMEAERHREGSWKDVWKNFFEVPGGQHQDSFQSIKTFEQAVRFLEEQLRRQLRPSLLLPDRDDSGRSLLPQQLRHPACHHGRYQ